MAWPTTTTERLKAITGTSSPQNKRLFKSDVTLRAYLCTSKLFYDWHVKRGLGVAGKEFAEKFLYLNGNTEASLHEMVTMDAVKRFNELWDKKVKESPLPRFVKKYSSHRLNYDEFAWSAVNGDYNVYFTLLGLEPEYNPTLMIRNNVMIKLHVIFELPNFASACSNKDLENEVLTRFTHDNCFVLKGDYRVDDDSDEIVYLNFNKIVHDRETIHSGLGPNDLIPILSETWIEL